MAFERSWPAVPPVQFTADGAQFGLITVSSTVGFKVKQQVTLQSSSQNPLLVEVKRVNSNTQLIVGKIGTNISDRSLSATAFTVADGAFIYANEQPKVQVPQVDQFQSVYEQEPSCAWRTLPVDPNGNPYTTENPLPVKADGVTFNGSLNVKLTDQDNVPNQGDTHDITRIGDGTNQLKINPNGSINAVVASDTTPVSVVSKFGTAAAVASGSNTTIVTYTCQPGMVALLHRIVASGENIAKYTVLLNGAPFDVRRTNFGADLNVNFEYTSGASNLFKLVPGDVLTVQVQHSRPNVADFDARIQLQEMSQS